MKDVKFLAIFAGSVVAMVGSLASGLVLGIILIIYHVSQGTPLKDMSSVMDQKHLSNSMPLLVCSLGLGGFFCLVGGFVTGWMAKVSPMKNGLLMGVLSTLLTVFFWSYYPAWFNVVGSVFTIGPAMAGGYLAQVFLSRRQPKSV